MIDPTETTTERLNYGALAESLAKAQASFPAISRDKEVTVQTKTGGSYKFKYAPLDSILNAVRKPLADNGLAITQLLDGGDLVTMLLHKDGASLSGRLAVPHIDGNVQAFGSAITYLRRYSIQAILGIAAEEDDDGNQAAGNTASFGKAEAGRNITVGTQEVTPDGGLIGKAIIQGNQDFNLRQSPNGYTLPFRIKNGTHSFIVVAENELAQAVETMRAQILDHLVTVWGKWTDETIPAKGVKPEIKYRILHLTKLQTPDFILPADVQEDLLPQPPDDVSLVGETPTAPLFDELPI
jgi:hypothetical protein